MTKMPAPRDGPRDTRSAGPRRGRGGLLLGVLIACSLSSLPVAAQEESRRVTTLSGRVIEESTSAPIAGVRVLLLNRYDRAVRTTISDSAGRFSFHQAPAGRFRLQASRIGYVPVTTPAWRLAQGDSMGVEVWMSVEAVVLAPLAIVSSRQVRDPSPLLDAFAHRRERGLGTFFTREDLERLRPVYVTDVLSTVPGVRVSGPGSGTGRIAYIGRAEGHFGDCPAQIYLDGFAVNRADGPVAPVPNNLRADLVSVDDIVAPGSIEAIEVYSGLSTIPPEFFNPSSRCGVIAIWTRRGRAR